MQIIAIVVSLAIAAVGIALFVRAIRSMLGVIRIGQAADRTDQPGARTVTMLKETLGHTRMLQWTWVGAAHWFVFVGFGLLFFTLLTAFGQLFDAHFALPLIGHFFLYEWVTEFFTVVMVVAILGLTAYRATRPSERTRGADGRFFGSTMWQGYFVELVILGVGLCIITLRGLEYALYSKGGEYAGNATAFHFPFTSWLGEAFSGLSAGTLAALIYLVAMLKIVISFTWMIVISLNITMGVAWHRFTAFFNIWFRREPSGRTALGEVKPLTSAGKPVSLDDIEELDEDATLGIGQAEDFSWKGILDFTTCTECGRCQSQCPAWNTDKPLSPKLLITALRDHSYAKAPYLRAGGEGSEAATALLERDEAVAREVERPLVGDTGDEWFYMPEDGSAVIDPDVLWSCTSCGACVQQCPVDIEHVDHIVDMRRYQVLVEANFPAELNQLFKGLENKGNPWNMSASARLDWAKGLDFDVPVVGEDLESLESVDWLFWVGCAGAYEDRAKKTTRAVAELLDMAGISFGVLGNGETCTGDPARRAGNEFVFQGLAQQNVETFREYKVKKAVTTCAHCFNTLKNEYRQLGIELEVVHHTQLLNRLVREGRLTPVTEGAGAAKRSITYHDPCFLGRHNQVYSPPRELLQVLPGAEYAEMERHSEKSFCCGAGGARMWMEENLGERINVNRTKEAVGTGADQIAVGCPFCRVMLSDGLTAEQSQGNAREEVEVLDVAQMLLASVKGEQATKAAPGSSAKAPATAGTAAGAGTGAATATAATATTTGATTGEGDVATKDEPESGDVTVTEDTVTDTEDMGPAAKASGGSSLFDLDDSAAGEPAETTDPDASTEDKAEAATPASSGGSLFDIGASDSSATAGTSTDSPGSGGPATQSTEQEVAEAPAAESAPETEDAAAGETAAGDTAAGDTAAEAGPDSGADLGSGGSLFDIAADEPAEAAAAKTEAADEPVDRSEDDAAPDEFPDEESADEESADATSGGAPATEPTDGQVAEAPPATSTGSAASPATEIPEDGSLFDLEAPEPAQAQAAPDEAPTDGSASSSGAPATAATGEKVADTPPAPSADESASSADVSAASGKVDPAAVSGATFVSDDEAEQVDGAAPAAKEPAEEPAEEPAQEPAAEEPAQESDTGPERPRSGGDGHQPRTDADISDSGSLFDL